MNRAMHSYSSLMGALLFGRSLLTGSGLSPMRHAPQPGTRRGTTAGDKDRLQAAQSKRERRRAKVIAEGRHK